MKSILVLLLLLSASCGPACVDDAEQPFQKKYIEYPVYIDPGNVNPEAVAGAVDFWNFEGNVIVEPSEKASIRVFKVDTLDVGVVGRAGRLGQYCVILVVDDDWDTIAHEIGHCLGFDHTIDGCSIMYKNEGRHPEMTEKIKSLLDYHSNVN